VKKTPAKTPAPDRLLLVIMPFGDHREIPRTKASIGPGDCCFDQWFKAMIEPAGVKAGFRVKRADQELSSGPIFEQFLEDLKDCHAALAFMTGLNPNVMYELGIAHALNKPVLLVADSREALPFDVTHLRFFRYDDAVVDKVGHYQSKLLEHLRQLLAHPEKAILRSF